MSQQMQIITCTHEILQKHWLATAYFRSLHVMDVSWPLKYEPVSSKKSQVLWSTSPDLPVPSCVWSEKTANWLPSCLLATSKCWLIAMAITLQWHASGTDGLYCFPINSCLGYAGTSKLFFFFKKKNIYVVLQVDLAALLQLKLPSSNFETKIKLIILVYLASLFISSLLFFKIFLFENISNWYIYLFFIVYLKMRVCVKNNTNYTIIPSHDFIGWRLQSKSGELSHLPMWLHQHYSLMVSC